MKAKILKKNNKCRSLPTIFEKKMVEIGWIDSKKLHAKNLWEK